MVGILWLILAVVLAVWLVGLLADFAGNIIHLLLIVALAILIYNLLTGRRTV
jgi:predicted membrane metal-binding protein